ncbi:MAG: DNA repair protein RadA [Planctomycetota bacterium]|nr:DNA repair protein RadA [Planctomycetota bacterium]
MAKKKGSYGCTSCGATSARWAGRCTGCGAMNTMVELTRSEAELVETKRDLQRAAAGLQTESLSDSDSTPVDRMPSGLGECDRVLGGGLPAGAAIVIGGEPGIGKSTLLAQIGGSLARTEAVLYITAEEATAQVRARCKRLGVDGTRMRLAATSDGEAITGAIASGDHRLVIVDSIQLTALGSVDGIAGSISQVRACATAFVEAAKRSGTTLVMVGHVTKGGELAGPRLLEHLVDTVLSFEGDRYQDLRSLRAIKNRYGATQEIGLFTMGQQGLEEVQDPGGLFIAGREASVPGSCVVPALEGNRCLLVEVQALVNPTDYPQPQRRVAGCDPNRVAMVVAVLSRRLRMPLGNCDVFVNVTAGARITEPSADIGIALAIASAWRDLALPTDMVALGEIGLGGELRPASRYELRAAEARRLGFKRLLGPGAGEGRGRIKARTVAEAIEAVLGTE